MKPQKSIVLFKEDKIIIILSKADKERILEAYNCAK